MQPTRRTLALAAATLIAAGSLATACGGDDAGTPSSTDATATTVERSPTSAPAVSATTAPATTAPATTAPAATAASTTAAPTTTVAVAEPGPLEVVTRDYVFEGMPAVLRAGAYEVTVRNEGAEVHEFVAFRPTTGKTLEELEAIGPGGFLEHAELAGFLPAVQPGETLAVPMTLTPGEWTLVCFLPAAHDQHPHFAHGMTQTFTVVA